nr:uncharacterized protein LOC117685419 [Crassostrea gigas]
MEMERRRQPPPPPQMGPFPRQAVSTVPPPRAGATLHPPRAAPCPDPRVAPTPARGGGRYHLRPAKRNFKNKRLPSEGHQGNMYLSQQSTDKNPKASNVQTRRLLLPSDSDSDSNDLSIHMSSPGPIPPLRKPPRKRISKCKKTQLKEKTPRARNVVLIGRVPMPSDSDSSDIDAPCGNQMGSRNQRNDMTQQPNVHVTLFQKISFWESSSPVEPHHLKTPQTRHML